MEEKAGSFVGQNTESFVGRNTALSGSRENIFCGFISTIQGSNSKQAGRSTARGSASVFLIVYFCLVSCCWARLCKD